MQYAVHSVCSGIVVYGGGDILFGAKRSNQWTQYTVDAINSGCSITQWMQWIQWDSGIWWSTASTVYCIHWFDLFAPKTMSLPPYTTIPLHPLCTASTGLTILHQRQCSHHHIPLFYGIHCILTTAFTVCTGLTFLYQRQCPHHHIPLFHCILHPLHTERCLVTSSGFLFASTD